MGFDEQMRHDPEKQNCHQADADSIPDEPRPTPIRISFELLAIFGLLAIYTWMDQSLSRAAALPLESYESVLLFPQLLGNAPTLDWHVIGLVPVGCLLIWRAPSLGIRWQEIQHGKSIRLLLAAAAGTLTWAYSTSEYNLYFDRSFAADRLLLIACCFALLWRPFFTLPFLLIVFPIISQLSVPLPGFYWAMPILPLRIVTLFAAMLILGLINKQWNSRSFAFAVCCVIAAHYWPSGFWKLTSDWLLTDHVYFLLPNTYANGWLGFLEPQAIADLTETLAVLNFPIKVLTLVLECGAILVLSRRSVLAALMVGWCCMHLGIFFVSGICFWMWCVVDLTVCLLLWKTPQLFEGLFSWRHGVAAALVVTTFPFWSDEVRLAWYDTRASYTYRYQAIGESGEEYWLPPDFFAPYIYQFTLSGFGYLSPESILPITWGATTNRTVADDLMHATTPNAVLAVERNLGQDRYDELRTRGMERFLKRFIGNFNRRRSNETWASAIAAPPILWTYPRGPGYENQETVKSVNVFQVLSFYDGSDYREIRTRLVLTVDIP